MSVWFSVEMFLLLDYLITDYCEADYCETSNKPVTYTIVP